jgi:hypothetical protein
MMTSAFRVLILVLCVLVLASVAGAQGVSDRAAPPSRRPSTHRASAVAGRAASSAEAVDLIVPPLSPLPLIGLTPCRIVDTRGNGFTGAYGPPSLAQGSPRDFALFGKCGIPASAGVVSLNVTVTNTQGPGFISIYPTGTSQPTVSTLNYVAGQTVANAAVVPIGSVGAGGAVTVVAGVSGADLIIDVNGYYGAPAASENDVFLGFSAGNDAMAGIGNVGLGSLTLELLTSGSHNTAVGRDALHGDTSGSQNTGVGSFALFANQSGIDNAALGYLALSSCANCSSNTGLGWQALVNNTNGFFNTAVGGNALFNITSGSDSNIAIGYAAALNLTSGTNNIHIGNPALSSESNTIRIGANPPHTRFFVAGVRAVMTGQANAVPVVIDGGGQLGTVSSSARYKREIADVDEESSALLRLRPVSFLYRSDAVGIRQYGLIAEEVAPVMPELVQYSEGGDPEMVNYHFLPPLLLRELQKQRKTIEQQNALISDLEERLAKLEACLQGEPTR